MNNASNDQLRRFIFDNSDIRGEIVTLKQSMHDAFSHQHYPTSINKLLGEFLTATSLLSRTLKFEGIMTLQARGEGDLSLIMAEINHQKKIRCVAQIKNEVGLDARSLTSLLGKGVLSITIDPNKGERYQGIVALDADTLAECLEDYFMQSEQLPTKIWLGSNDDTASGLLLQRLPQQVASAEENNDMWETQAQLANTVSTEEMLTLEHTSLLTRLFHESGVRVFDAEHIVFGCSCSQERSNQTLKPLGEESLQQMIKEEGRIVVDCHFCGFQYIYKAANVRELFSADTQH